MDGFRFSIEQKVAWRDLDALGHVNNAVYSTYFENARLEYIARLQESGMGVYNSLILAEITVTFKSPAFLGELLEIGVRVSEIRNSSFVVESHIVAKETGRLVATSHAVIVHYDYTINKAKPVPQEWRQRIAQSEGWES